jgi:hypothetical protein
MARMGDSCSRDYRQRRRHKQALKRQRIAVTVGRVSLRPTPLLLSPKPLLLSLCLLTACAPDAGSVADDAGDDAVNAAETADDIAADIPATDVWPDDYWVPENIDQLYGYWQNDDGQEIRAFEFAQFDLFDADMVNVTPTYELFRYPKGKSKVLFERGRATLAPGPTLHLQPVWSDSSTHTAAPYDLTFLAAGPKSFAIATGTSGARVYQQVW